MKTVYIKTSDTDIKSFTEAVALLKAGGYTPRRFTAMPVDEACCVVLCRVTPQVLALLNSRPEDSLVLYNPCDPPCDPVREPFIAVPVSDRRHYDAVFVMSSFNRAEGVNAVINGIRQDRSELSHLIILLNDGSTTGDYERFRHEPDVLYLENPCNYGRKRYWESINRLFEAASGFSFRVLVQVDDDFVLCRNFLQEITRLSESGDGAVHYHINDNPGDAGRWGLVHWVDGGCAFSYRVMKALNFRTEPVAPCRWMRDPNASSGVWHNISNTLNRLGITVTKPDYSMAVHRGNHDSKMNSALRKEVKIHSHY